MTACPGFSAVCRAGAALPAGTGSKMPFSMAGSAGTTRCLKRVHMQKLCALGHSLLGMIGSVFR